MSLPNLDHGSAADAALNDLPAGLDHIGKADLGGHFLEFSSVEIEFEPFPRLFTVDARPLDRVDAEQRYPAQDEWGYARRQIHTACKPASRDCAPVPDHREPVGQR